MWWVKVAKEAPNLDLHSYLAACHKAAKMLSEAGVPKDEIPKKLSEAVKVILEWVG